MDSERQRIKKKQAKIDRLEIDISKEYSGDISYKIDQNTN
jgi:hypothetical protein